MPRYMVKVERDDGGYDRYGVDAEHAMFAMGRTAERLGLDNEARVGVRLAMDDEKLFDLPPKRKKRTRKAGE